MKELNIPLELQYIHGQGLISPKEGDVVDGVALGRVMYVIASNSEENISIIKKMIFEDLSGVWGTKAYTKCTAPITMPAYDDKQITVSFGVE